MTLEHSGSLRNAERTGYSPRRRSRLTRKMRNSIITANSETNTNTRRGVSPLAISRGAKLIVIPARYISNRQGIHTDLRILFRPERPLGCRVIEFSVIWRLRVIESFFTQMFVNDKTRQSVESRILLLVYAQYRSLPVG